VPSGAGIQLMGTAGGGNVAVEDGGTLDDVTMHKYLPAACRPAP